MDSIMLLPIIIVVAYILAKVFAPMFFFHRYDKEGMKKMHDEMFSEERKKPK